MFTMDVAEVLAKHKLRVTKPRLQVLHLFMTTNRALSASEIEEQLPGFDRITLYRTLKNFEGSGIIHQAINGESTPSFAMCETDCTHHQHHDDHAHFHCTTCGDTFCVESIPVQLTIPKDNVGFAIDSMHLVLRGTCQKCQS